MAKVKKGLGLKGSINGKTYYDLKKVGPVVRKTRGPSLEEMLANPNYNVTLNNTKELGGGSTASKAIREGLGQNTVVFKDSYMPSRLTQALKKAIRNGTSSNTPRPLQLKNHPHHLIGFQLDKTKSLSSLWKAPFQSYINEQQNAIVIDIPKISPYHYSKITKGTTHAVLTGAVSLLSIHNWDHNLQKYLPLNPQQNAIGNATHSEGINIHTMAENIQLVIPLPNNTSLDMDTTATLWLGITFCQQVQNQFLPLASQKAMQCIAVF